jgi:heme-degrading monooxygenase HmoA
MHLLVLDRFDAGPEAEDRWQEWYQAERLPRWRALGGFAAARAYRRLEGGGPSHLVLVALRDDPGTAEAAQALVRGGHGAAGAPVGVCHASASAYVPFWERQAAGHGGGTALNGPIQTVTLNIFGEKEKEINAWYEEKHIPELLEYPGLQWARRHRRLAGGTRYLTLYHFASEAAVRAYMKSDIVRAAQADRQRYNPWMSILEHTAYVPILEFTNSSM